MRKRQILYFGLLFAFIFALLYTGERIFLWGLLFMLSALTFSLFTLLVTLFGLRAEHTVTPPVCEKGDTAELSLKIRNQTPLFASHLTLWYSLPGGPEGDMRSLSLALLPFSGAEVTESIFCAHRGEYPLSFSRAEMTDPFGLFSITLPFSAFRAGRPARLVVEPPAPLLAEDRLFNVPREEISPLGGSLDEDPTELRDIRIFRPGDPLKRVHWKISARGDTLYSKVFDGSKAASSIVLLDGALGPHSGELKLLIEDSLCECAAIFCKSFLYYGRAAKLVTYAAERTEISGGSLADYAGMKNFLGRFQFSGDAPLEKALAFEFLSGSASGVVVVTHRLGPGVRDAVISLSASGIPVTLVPVLPETRFEEPMIKLLGELAMRGIRTITVFPEESPVLRLSSH